tara:strand:+ start:36226 stop:36726 length:501 start_codon:yes stop_codon:yes gene_type:complete
MKKTPVVIDQSERLFVGLNIRTSLSENKVKKLWQSFGPKRKEINHQITLDSYSIEIYEPGSEMINFTPNTKFEKWATVQVSEFEAVPEGLETLVIPKGKYAVFIYKGLHSEYPKFAQYIFSEWLPSSDYELDDRPHFEVMGNKYFGPMNPDSEEEIWIPIKDSIHL